MYAKYRSLFTKLFRRTPKTIRNPKPMPRARLDLTALEDRCVPATFLTASLDMSQGVLSVEGTDDADQIRIIHQDGSVAVEGIQITLTDLDGNVSQVDAVDSSLIGWSWVDALGGDDTVVIDDSAVVNDNLFLFNIYGGEGTDWLQGGLSPVTLFGQDGTDTLIGGYGDDVVYGGEGDDIISGGDGIDYLYGEGDNDIVSGDAGDDFLYGGDGSDQLSGGVGNDFLYGASGTDGYEEGASMNDTLQGEDGADYLYGGYGDDLLVGGNDNDWIRGQWGNDIVVGANYDFVAMQAVEVEYVTAAGYTVNDTLFGENGVDKLYGGLGDDRLEGGWDNDTLYGGDGNDRLYGEAANSPAGRPGSTNDDFLYGGNGSDQLSGGVGNDFLYGANGTDGYEEGASMNDTLQGDDGADYLYGGYGDDLLVGGNDNDWIRGQWGNDIVVGANYDFVAMQAVEVEYVTAAGYTVNDTLFGENGVDKLYGGLGDDRLEGGWDNDTLYGDSGNDRLWGEAWDSPAGRPGSTNNDYLYGGAGSDQMVGGDGDDVIVAIDNGTGDTVTLGAGRDVAWADRRKVGGISTFDTVSGAGADDKVQYVAAFANGADRTLDGDRIADPGLKPAIPATGTTPAQPAAATAYRTFSGNRLFGNNGPTLGDIRQQALGDCWLLATLGAVARDNPQAIRQMVVDFGDGTYGVRLGDNFYRVDNDLPVAAAESVNTVYAGLGAQNSMWVAVVEKAYAQFRVANGFQNNYAALEGGWGSEAAAALGSTATGARNFSAYGSAAAMANDIATRFNNRQAVTVGWVDRVANVKYLPFGLINDHVYTVAGINYGANGAVASIVLRNPWGVDTDAAGGALDGINDGFVTVTPAQLFSINGRVDWGAV